MYCKQPNANGAQDPYNSMRLTEHSVLTQPADSDIQLSTKLCWLWTLTDVLITWLVTVQACIKHPALQYVLVGLHIIIRPPSTTQSLTSYSQVQYTSTIQDRIQYSALPADYMWRGNRRININVGPIVNVHQSRQSRLSYRHRENIGCILYYREHALSLKYVQNITT